ncbi:MBL fold metallo-hydrolase [Vineibacter terrae]|uniref:MBL fold metallo-hydrolase n=1 Tax=Vineibacter terrae TaxID=2586908 RepID=UPI001C499B8C|nr:MBL fold metallo-hydrolase [Vineibacter terrae]
MLASDLAVKFWGVRGSIACAGPQYVRYGGNTSCLEVTAGGRRLIFDAGTGLRPLGDTLCSADKLDVDIFFTHTHFDHICGLTFFKPLYTRENKVRLWAGHLAPILRLVDVVKQLMMAPLYPVTLDIFVAKVEFRDFRSGETLRPAAGVRLRTAPLNHPNGATGYRIEHGGKAICYITDTEHRGGPPDPVVVELCRDADVMIYDSTYTDAEYPSYRGWGHSTWQEGIRVADAANVGSLVIFHHDPSHDDAFMDGVERDAQAARPGTAKNGQPRAVVAREGMVIAP